MDEQQRDVVEGVVERVVYVRRDGFTIVRLSVAEGQTISASGDCLLDVQPGETLRLQGTRSMHPSYGEQLHATTCQHVAPSSCHAIRAYLASGLVKGIGRRLAEAIVDEFGEHTLDVIDETPERLLEVHLIGTKRYADILDAWQQHQEIRQIMVLLQNAGVSARHAPRIVHHFRDVVHEATGACEVLEIVCEHPYRLTEVHRVGFRTADRVALSLGLPEHGAERLQAAIVHVLEEVAGQQGHCFLRQEELLDEADRSLGGSLRHLLPEQLDVLRAERHVVIEPLPQTDRDQGGAERRRDRGPAVFGRRLHAIEESVAHRLGRLSRARSELAARCRWRGGPLPLLDSTMELHPDQEAAVRMALTEPVSVLTGGPGCGKSFTVRAVVELAEAFGAKVSLAAPTGKAAKRLNDLTGRQATTVHRLIYPPRADPAAQVSLFDAHDPLEADLFVIDEASMLDVRLFDRLLEKIPAGAHLLLAGDVDQLPSVGPGRVLADLLRVEAVPRVALTHIFRQAMGSSITTNAHRIRAGESLRNGGDFYFIEVKELGTLADEVVDIVTRRLPERYQVPHSDIQVLCPANKGAVGTLELGLRLQDIINPGRDGEPVHWSERRPFRVGDRVMPVRNNPRKGANGVFNGSAATVTAVDTTGRTIRIQLEDGDSADYGFDELDTLLHSYAITVHRSQGSEYPFVVVPLLKDSSTIMLRQNLLYTAVTRGKRMVVLVGQHAALMKALNTPELGRNTRLAVRVRDALAGDGPGPGQLRAADGQAPLY
ncbi:ATP-dependent RecD-like DNA helicase [Kitasatospora sp. Ki12]